MAGNRYTYGYYSGRSRPAETNQADPVTQTAKIHVVVKGDTLYSIAFACGEDVRTVASWNHIRPPYTIFPNQVLRLTPPPPPPERVIGQQREPRIPAPTRVRSAVHSGGAKTPRAKSRYTQKISWQWPTNGKIISAYSAKDVGKKGLDIAGKIGQPIYAAASGVIVYSGNGLRGYGQLIIIKHSDTYFSAYAHNRRILVKEDQKVNKGQHIADMGSSEADRPLLHFEVRRDGKPVDPLQYLPRRH